MAAAAGSMTSTVKNVIGYITSICAITPQNRDAITETQTVHCIRLLSNMATSDNCTGIHDDAASALALLQGESCFTENQKHRIASAIDSAMSGSTVASGSDQQTHPHLESYLNKTMWDAIMSHMSLSHIWELLAQYCVQTLKLRNPCEKTRRDLVAIVLTARHLSMHATESRIEVNRMKTCFEVARAAHLHGSKGPSQYPPDPTTFMVAFPDAFANDTDKPIASRIASISLDVTKRYTPCRDSHKGVTNRTNPKAQRQHTSNLASLAEYVSGAMSAHSLAAMPEVAAFVKNQVKAEKQEPHVQAAPEVDANAVMRAAKREPCPDVHPHAEQLGPVVGNLDELRRLTEEKFKAGGLGKRSVLKRPASKRDEAAGDVDDEYDGFDDVDDEADDDAGPCDESDGAHNVPIVRKKPAHASGAGGAKRMSVMKKPAGVRGDTSVMKKPAGASGWVVESRMTGNGRDYKIYTSPDGRQFRSRTEIVKVLKKPASVFVGDM